MIYQEFITKFKAHTKEITYQQQLNLAISVCKKLFFDYQEFSQQNKWGDLDTLLDAINLISQSLNLQPDTGQTKQMLQRIEAITPDTEDFDNASYALNACAAVYESLEFILDKDPQHVFNIGTCLTDTIDFKIQEDDELTELQINSHPEMINARRFLFER